MRKTEGSRDEEALDGDGNCKDIKTIKAKDKVTMSRWGWLGTIDCVSSTVTLLDGSVVDSSRDTVEVTHLHLLHFLSWSN